MAISMTILSRVLVLVLDATWKGGVVALLVAFAVALLGRRLGARWRHALWLLVVARLAIPVAPQASWSVFNLFDSAERSAVAHARGGVAMRAAFRGEAPPEVILVRSEGESGRTSSLMWLWLAGVAAAATRLAWVSVRARRSVERLIRRESATPELRELVDGARAQLGIRRPIAIVSTDAARTPALHGLFRPVLLLPAAVVEKFDRDELRHIILHELWHLRRHDVATSWLLSVVTAVHWFNPLAWLAAARIREEREICCDELALSCLEEDERSGYGRTILKLLAQFRTASPVPALVGIVNPKRQMKRRLTMIASFQNSRRFPALFLGAAALVGAFAFTDARGGEEHRVRMRMMPSDPASRATFEKLHAKVSLDLNNASFSDLLNTISTKSGVTVTQSPEIATSAAQSARFTIAANNVPAHMVLMEALMPFSLTPRPDANGVTVEQGGGCMKMEHHEEMTTDDKGNVEKRVIVREQGDGAHAMVMQHSDLPPGAVERRFMIEAKADGDCKLGADGTVHRNVKVQYDENGEKSEGTLKLDIAATPSK